MGTLLAHEAFAPRIIRGYAMGKLLWVGLGLCAIAALWRAEQEEDGTIVALSPFLAALALEAGIFMLRQHQSQLLTVKRD